MKQAILSVAHRVELLVKERLRRVLPALIFEKVDEYPSLDARTVGTERALTRLARIENVRVRPADQQLLRSLRRTRNAIEHGEWHTTAREAKVIVGASLSFALDFAQAHLGRDLSYSTAVTTLGINSLGNYGNSRMSTRGDSPLTRESMRAP